MTSQILVDAALRDATTKTAIAAYRAAYEAANGRPFEYEIEYQSGWFVLYRNVDGQRFFHARYRRAQLTTMTATLVERAIA